MKRKIFALICLAVPFCGYSQENQIVEPEDSGIVRHSRNGTVFETRYHRIGAVYGNISVIESLIISTSIAIEVYDKYVIPRVRFIVSERDGGVAEIPISEAKCCIEALQHFRDNLMNTTPAEKTHFEYNALSDDLSFKFQFNSKKWELIVVANRMGNPIKLNPGLDNTITQLQDAVRYLEEQVKIIGYDYRH